MLLPPACCWEAWGESVVGPRRLHGQDWGGGRLSRNGEGVCREVICFKGRIRRKGKELGLLYFGLDPILCLRPRDNVGCKHYKLMGSSKHQ